MNTDTLILETEQQLREYQNQDLPKLKPKTKIRQAQLKWLQEQNLMITQEELEAFETYSLMVRNKLNILKAVYQA
ncbi:MAG: hypothetical protein SWJ54_06700 [Cyanobacteriota bacterium]|nr:hypothetical protein [Cyanobacteriota bacterium]